MTARLAVLPGGDVVYRGTRTNGSACVTVERGAKSYPLDPRLGVRNHSPTGFEWGCCGSGPAQLALAILYDFLGAAQAPIIKWLVLDMYQDFKRLVVAGLPHGGFTLTDIEIADALETLLGEEETA